MEINESSLLSLANSILARVPGSSRVSRVKDINARLFVSLYEGLFAESLPDVIKDPKSSAEEAHNVQAVIDTLSLDILNTSLSHLSGDAVVSGDRGAVKSLLEVFEWLFEYILERIGSEASSEAGERTRDLDDPDLVTSEVIDSILERELGRSKTSKVTFAHGTKSAGNNSTAELIALGSSSRDMSNVSPDKTADMIALGDSRYLNGTTPPTRDRALARDQSARDLASSRDRSTRDSVISRDPLPDAAGLSRDIAMLSVGGGSLPLATSPYRAPESKNNSLSTGPLTPDSHTHGAGWRSAAELEQEIQTLRGSIVANSSALQDGGETGRVSGSTDGSLVYPQSLSARELRDNTHFQDLGDQPLSARSAYDSMSASMPAGHQYHSYTHHLYHHYHPVSNVLRPLSQSLPVAPGSATQAATKHAQVTRDTQVTPGRFSRDEPRDAKTSRGASHTQTGTQDTSASRRGGESSYKHLRQMLEDTRDLSAHALSSSPLRTRADPGDEALTRRLRDTLRKLHTDVEESAASLNGSRSKHKRQQNVQGILSPTRKTSSRGTRKVSFQSTRPARSSPQPNRSGQGDKSDRNTTTSRSHTRGSRSSSLSPNKRPSSAMSYSKRSTSSLSPAKRPSSSLSPTKPRGSALSPSAESEAVESKDESELSTPGRREEVLRALYRRMRRRRSSRKSRPRSQRRYGSLTADDSYLSDGVVQYGRDSDRSYEGDFSAELARYKRLLARSGRGLDDVMDEKAAGHVGHIRRQLQREEAPARQRSQFLKDTYAQNVLDYAENIQDTMNALKQSEKQVDKEYKSTLAKSAARNKPPRRRKVTSSVLYSRCKTAAPRSTRSARRRSASSPLITSKQDLGADDVLPLLLEELPFLHLSSETLHGMWRRAAAQVKAASQSDAQARRGTTKQQQAVKEAEDKQRRLADIARKEISHTERKREAEARRTEQLAVRAAVRDKRLQHARLRKYYDEYAIRMRSKMLKKRTRQEVVFRRLFEDALRTQGERVREMRTYAKQQRDQRTRKQTDQLASIENFYRDRLTLLAGALKEERVTRTRQATDQQQALKSLSRELRVRTEQEIETLQDAVFRDDDDVHFRQIDADRLRAHLHRANYQACV